MSRAVVFTHIDERNRLEDTSEILGFYDRRGAFFRSCLACRNISIVFVYSSYGVEECIRAVLCAKEQPQIPVDVLEKEQRVANALQMVLERAALHVFGADAARRRESGPEFVFIGVRELACHLNRLMRIDRKLVENFAHQGKSTYDSPKNIEAIIRIARARRFPEETVIRVDADVQVDEIAIDRLLECAAVCRADPLQPYWWFSGGYSGNFDDDPVNVHAVRQHWLVSKETRHNPRGFQLVPNAEAFLADIAEIGATQFDARHHPRRSRAAEKMVHDRGYSSRRAGPQVISGAGLVASAAAIEKLPPFMNAPAMVVWIDDHLKRLLHEAIGDISPRDPERIDALLRQDRYPGPDAIDDSDPAEFEKRTHDYFERLLNGCLMEATIETKPNHPGPLATWVHNVTTATLTRLTADDEVRLRAELCDAAQKRFDHVMAVWQHADYGDDMLAKWAAGVDDERRKQICGRIGDIGAAYVRLCIDWEHHVAAIGTLQAHDAYWLFTKPRPLAPAATAPASLAPPAPAGADGGFVEAGSPLPAGEKQSAVRLPPL